MSEIEQLRAELRALRREVEYLKSSLLPDVSMPRQPWSPTVDFGNVTVSARGDAGTTI
jgi:hypothetical protein